jgi:hypothetical protein
MGSKRKRIPIIIELLRLTTYLGLFFLYRLEWKKKEKDDSSNVDDSSSLVDKVIEISNLDLVKDLVEVIDFLYNTK